MLAFKVYNKFVVMAGLRTKPIDDVKSFIKNIENLARSFNAEIILLNGEIVYSWRVILKALELALRAFKRGTNIAKKLPLEVMLYLHGVRQIREAIKVYGLKEGVTNIAVVILAESPHYSTQVYRNLIEQLKMKENSSVLKPSSLKAKLVASLYNISQKELEASKISGKETMEELIEKLLISRVVMTELLH